MNALSLNALGNEMRIARSLVLAACLMFAPLSIGQQPEAKPVVEYNIAACGGHDFTVEHAVLSADRTKLSLDYYLVNEKTAKKDDKPLVFDMKFDPKNEDGAETFSGDAKLDDSGLHLSGGTYGNRFIAIMTVNGNLGHVFYGYKGSLEDITVGVQDKAQFCVDLRGIDQKLFAKILVQFLFDGAVDVPTNKS